MDGNAALRMKNCQTPDYSRPNNPQRKRGPRHGSPSLTLLVSPLTTCVTYEFWLVGDNAQGDGPENNHVTHVAT